MDRRLAGRVGRAKASGDEGQKEEVIGRYGSNG